MSRKRKPVVGLRYVGRGEFVFGVPARDLTTVEAEKYRVSIDAAEAAIGRKLYEVVGERVSLEKGGE